MTDASNNLELNNTSLAKSGVQQWADVFYGVLVAPQQTMAVLADNSQYKSNGTALLMAGITVFSSVLLALIGACGGDFGATSQLCITICLIVGLQTWALLSLLLYTIARIFSASSCSIGSAFVVTGWAFMPLYFVSPVKCLLNIPLVGILSFCALGAWILFLEYAACKSNLNLTNRKMLALAVAVPVLYKLSILSGLIFVAALIF